MIDMRLSSNLTPDSSTRNIIRLAILEHLRHWWASDGLFHSKIIRSDGTICPLTVRKITNSYGVTRGLLAGKEAEVARLLDENLQDWPDTLLKRAAFVRHMAEEANNREFTKGKLLSAFSKIIWFAKPEGWTLYDSFAHRGLKSALHAEGVDNYEKHYNRLNNLEFEHAIEIGHNIVSEAGFRYLWPERIHDKYLMYVGHNPAKGQSVVDDEAHHNLLALWGQFYGVQLVKEIERLAEKFTSALCDHPAFQVHTLVGKQ